MVLPKPSIMGKWYHSNQGKYYRSIDRADIARYYEFKAGNKIIFSSCTDMCGCMRKEWIGHYKWENDSIMIVNYTHIKGGYGGNLPEKNLDPKEKKLKIFAIPNGLKIQELR